MSEIERPATSGTIKMTEEEKQKLKDEDEETEKVVITRNGRRFVFE